MKEKIILKVKNHNFHNITVTFMIVIRSISIGHYHAIYFIIKVGGITPLEDITWKIINAKSG